MFKVKQKSLISKTDIKGKENAFIKAASKKAVVTQSGNGAMKYATTGQPFVDQFGSASTYKQPRTYDQISTDMSTLWSVNPIKAIAFIIYLRIITRVVTLFTGIKTSTVQRGQGLRYEGIMRMVWLNVNHRATFWRNVPLFIAVGSWKDIIMMLSYDLQYNGWDNRTLDWDNMGILLLSGLENPSQSNLIKKYLPQIKSNSRCTTIESQADNIIAKWMCSLLFGTKESAASYKKYRKLKTSGTAHEWQKLISTKNLINIDFKTIHGRALAQLVSSKFLKNNGLEAKYDAWLEKQPIVKFTGYPYELFKKISNLKQYQVNTINKQFMGLVETAKKGINQTTSLIVVRDTSGSMSSSVDGTTMSCGDVAKALALYFSYLLPKGAFADSWIEFHTDAKLRKWQGKTPMERWNNDHSSYVGGTNFQSVINLLCSIKKQGVPESEFPTGIVCISDGEFNPIHLNKTNVDVAYKALEKAGFSKEYLRSFQIVLWNLHNNYYSNSSKPKFETHGETQNVFYFSGLDGSVISFLTGMEGQLKAAPKTDAELVEEALSQEVMSLIKL